MTFSTTGSPIEARAQNQGQFPLIFAVAGGVVLVLAFLIQLYRQIMKPYHSPAYIEKQKKRPTNQKDIRAVSQEYSLTPEEAQFLAVECKKNNIPNIRYYVKDYEQALGLFRAAYKESVSDAQAEYTQSLIFSIFKKINKARLAESAMTTTTTLAVGQKLFYVDAEGKKYVTAIVENDEKELMLSVPKSKAGDEIMLPNLAKINLMLQGKSDIAFTMQVRVLRSQTKLGDTVIVTTHGTQFESFLKHEYVYIKARLPCMLQQARATPSARGEAEYEADGRTYKGLLLNYSGTSCNIVVKNAINVHQLLSLEAKFDGEHVEDCVVMAMNVVENKGAFIIHANFVRMSEKLRNYILAHIYLFTGQGD